MTVHTAKVTVYYGAERKRYFTAGRAEFQKSASFAGNPRGFADSYSAAVRQWRAYRDGKPMLADFPTVDQAMEEAESLWKEDKLYEPKEESE